MKINKLKHYKRFKENDLVVLKSNERGKQIEGVIFKILPIASQEYSGGVYGLLYEMREVDRKYSVYTGIKISVLYFLDGKGNQEFETMKRIR